MPITAEESGETEFCFNTVSTTELILMPTVRLRKGFHYMRYAYPNTEPKMSLTKLKSEHKTFPYKSSATKGKVTLLSHSTRLRRGKKVNKEGYFFRSPGFSNL